VAATSTSSPSKPRHRRRCFCQSQTLVRGSTFRVKKAIVGLIPKAQKPITLDGAAYPGASRYDYDPNQALYTTASTFPIKDDPFALVVNCRNTHAIHRVCYQFYKGHKTDPPSIPDSPSIPFAPPPSPPSADGSPSIDRF
jgi:hypothetical protein